MNLKSGGRQLPLMIFKDCSVLKKNHPLIKNNSIELEATGELTVCSNYILSRQ